MDRVGRMADAGDHRTAPAIDVERNAAVLVDLLDLADHLPSRPKPALDHPVFRDQVV